jgi:hypothetical protein
MRLEDWLDPRHLDAAGQSAYAAAFASAPYSSVVIDHFLRPEKLAVLQRVFSTEGRFAQRYYLWQWDEGGRHEIESSPEVWHAAPDVSRAFVEGVFEAPHPEHRIGQGVAAHYKFVALLASPEFMHFLDRVTGVRPATLTGLLARTMIGGQYIPPHSDFMPIRDLCGVFYASGEWQPSFGGRFRHCSAGSDSIPIEPRMNRLLLFRPGRDCRHDVEPIAEAGANWQRWSYSMWFGTPAPTGT